MARTAEADDAAARVSGRLAALFMDRSRLECLRDTGGYQVYKANAAWPSLLVKRSRDPAFDLHKEYEMLREMAGEEGFPRVAGYWEDQGEQTLAREYLEGETLEELYDRLDPVPEKRVLEIGVALCRTLGRLHRHGLVHRDVKPANVLLTPGGGCALLDLGASRRHREGGGPDTTLLGTRNFAAPEQYGFSQTDARTDVYGLGMTLLYLLTGRADRSALTQTRRGIRRVLKKCLALSPEERYADAASVQRALKRLLRARDRRFLRIGAAAAALTACAALALLPGRFTPAAAPAPAAPIQVATGADVPVQEIRVRNEQGITNALRSAGDSPLRLVIEGTITLEQSLVLDGSSVTLAGGTLTDAADAWPLNDVVTVKDGASLTLADGAAIEANHHLTAVRIRDAGNFLLDGGRVENRFVSANANDCVMALYLPAAGGQAELRRGTLECAGEGAWTVNMDEGTRVLLSGAAIRSVCTRGGAMLQMGGRFEMTGGVISGEFAQAGGYCFPFDCHLPNEGTILQGGSILLNGDASAVHYCRED